jgi:putative pyruvate formate lyase activating enzyme
MIPRVAAVSLHHGEEPPISGTRGSGNIFFSGCSLNCSFCQNYPISQLGVGRDMSVDELAEAMLTLERRGAHNINLVTPTAMIPQIASAVVLARSDGLSLPVIYNTNGYESPATLAALEGIIDVYLPDMKYAEDQYAMQYSGAPDYVIHNRQALKTMHDQVGHLRMTGGLAVRGLIVRHLILPVGRSGTGEVLAYLSSNYGPDLYLSLMSQYFPAYRALDDPVIGRRLNQMEHHWSMEQLDREGFRRGWCQKYSEGISGFQASAGRPEHSGTQDGTGGIVCNSSRRLSSVPS